MNNGSIILPIVNKNRRTQVMLYKATLLCIFFGNVDPEQICKDPTGKLIFTWSQVL
jgi:hypothetical protein